MNTEELISKQPTPRTDLALTKGSRVMPWSEVVKLELAVQLEKELGACREAMKEFVDRCNRGETRSIRTKAKFESLLAATEPK